MDAAPGDAGGDTPEVSAPDCPPPPVAPGAVRARILSCEEELPTGRLASGRVGDLVVENSRARFVIRSGTEGHAIMGLTGGNLVDAVLIDGAGAQIGSDGLREYVTSAFFYMLRPDAVTVTDSGDGGTARVRVTGSLQAFPTVHTVLPVPAPEATLSHEYVLRPDETALEIVTKLTAGSGDAVQIADVMFFGGETELFIPGFGAWGLPEAATVPTAGAAPAFPAAGSPAYATGAAVPRELVNLTAIRGFLYPPVEVPSDGTGAEVTRILAVSATLSGAMAAVRDALEQPSKPISGVVEGHFDGVGVDALDGEGAPLTRCAVDADGAFACRVPEETEAVRARWTGSGTGERGGPGQVGPSVPAGDGLTVGPPPNGSVTVSLAGDATHAFRLSAWPAGGAGGKEDRRHLVSLGEPLTVRLPPGDWDLWVTHGPLWSRHHAVITVAAGGEQQVTATLSQVVKASGWISADLHVHSDRSPDSDVTPTRRLRGAAAEALDYVVTTEHDFVGDASTAGPDGLLVRTGVEVTSMHLGHFNVWPAIPDPSLAGMGAPRWFDHETAESLLGALHDLPGGPLVQCNHPRFESGYLAYFDVVDPAEPATLPAALRCDLLEVVNGFAHADTPQVLADWMVLLKAGYRMTATGVSDTHDTRGFVGNPRTLVRLEGPATTDAVELALREGRAIATAGPFLSIELLGVEGERAGIGDTLATSGEVTARITLAAPDWLALGEVHVVVDGDEVFAEDLADLPASSGARTWTKEIPVTVVAGGFVLAWHGGTAASPPGTHQPGWAVTNPVWVAP